LIESLSKLGLDYVDLFLIHTPNGRKVVETWNAVVQLKRDGLIKSAGVRFSYF
jgi:diketogulonate reductase-like aldo/keto reductase